MVRPNCVNEKELDEKLLSVIDYCVLDGRDENPSK